MGDFRRCAAARAAGLRHLLLLVSICIGFDAFAADGPYVVDDSEIGGPGECRVESWGSRSDTRSWIAVVTPTCTFHALPFVELSVLAMGQWSPGSRGWNVGPKAKVSLVPIEKFGVGIGAAAGWTYSTADRRTGLAFVTAAFTAQPVEPLRLNANLGWAYHGEIRTHRLFYGAGFEWAAIERVSLIGEVFGFHGERAGFQAGLRPTLIKDTLDLDLVYGRNIDGSKSNWFSFGGILRF